MSDLHIWAGLLLGWLLYAVFLTGSVSYFRDEISAWMRPDVPAQEAPADPVQVTGRMIGWLAERAPQAPQWGISLPSARSPGVNLFWLGDGPRRFMERRLDPRTGEPLSRREALGGEFFYRFHFNLHYMSPITGRWIVGVAAMFMLVAIISGIITHKKIFAEFFTFRWGKGQRSWLDAHNGLAVLGLPFHLMITWSGLVTLMMLYMPWGALTAFPTRADQMRQQQVITGFRLPAPRSGHAAPLGDVPAMVAQARDRWGAQGVGRVYVNNPGEAQARVIVLRSIEGQVSVSPQYLVFDGTSGRLLEQHDTARPAAETRGGADRPARGALCPPAAALAVLSAGAGRYRHGGQRTGAVDGQASGEAARSGPPVLWLPAGGAAQHRHHRRAAAGDDGLSVGQPAAAG